MQVPLRQSREWQMALDNLEQMHPRYLADLLQEPERLLSVLDRRVVSHFKILEKLQKAYPNASTDELMEMALPESLAPVNPDWQDEEPLDAQEQETLQAFLESQEGESHEG